MKLHPTDAFPLASLLAAIACLLLAQLGRSPDAIVAFLAAYGLDALWQLAAPSSTAHRFGAELRNVVALVAFAACPAVLVYVLLSPSAPFVVAAGAAACVLLAGSLRMALLAFCGESRALRSTGLPRPQLALAAVAFCASPVAAEAVGAFAAAGLVVVAASLAIAPLSFVRPFAPSPPPLRAALGLFAVASVGAAFLLGAGAIVLAAWGVVVALPAFASPFARVAPRAAP